MTDADRDSVHDFSEIEPFCEKIHFRSCNLPRPVVLYLSVIKRWYDRLGHRSCTQTDKLRILYAGVAQQAERVLGKDEVTGSNPVISSIKKDIHLDVFFY